MTIQTTTNTTNCLIKGFFTLKSIEIWISIFGSIASIGGAFWAFIEARKSSQSASKAEEIKNTITKRRKLIEINQIHAETTKILNKVSSIGPACDTKLLRGIKGASIAIEVGEYTRHLNEHISDLNEPLKTQTAELCENLRSDIETLSEAITAEDLKSIGKIIYYKIYNILPSIKKESDQSKEQF